VFGKTYRWWVELFFICHCVTPTYTLRTEWPEGGTLMQQPMVVVKVFEIIGNEVHNARQT